MPPRSLPTGMNKPSMPSGGRLPMVRQPAGSPAGRSQLRDFSGRFRGAGVTWMGIDATIRYWEDLERRTDEGARKAAEKLAKDTVQWMKRNAAWQDRTGEARQQLKGDVQFREGLTGSEGASQLRIYLAHGVDYGEHLELSMGGRFQIIRPGLARLAQKLPSSIVEEIGL